ncbi:DUF1937 family protein [Thioclava sp. BHET1]|nr:DUF1937 family protein [Thioclava sp. BHET1]
MLRDSMQSAARRMEVPPMYSAVTPFPVSDRPNWAGLRDQFRGTGLLIEGHSAQELGRMIRGSVVCLVAPYEERAVDAEGAWSAFASEVVAVEAAIWAKRLAVGGCTALAPAVLRAAMLSVGAAGSLDPMDKGVWWDHRQAVQSACSAVVVPPIRGWADSVNVWRDVCHALRRNTRVWLIAPEDAASQIDNLETRESSHAD